MPYAISFKDLHNFWLPCEDYCKLFNEKFLSVRLPTEGLNIDDVVLEKPTSSFMNLNTHLVAREKSEIWNDKYYPKTLTEYVKILDDYLLLCEKNSVRPIMLLFPVTKCYSKYFCKNIISEFYHFIDEAQQKHPPHLSLLTVGTWKALMIHTFGTLTT